MKDTSSWDGVIQFLNHGPLGLIAMVFVLIFMALSLLKASEQRERLMRLTLFAGLFCFVFATLPQYVTAILTAYNGRDDRQVKALHEVVSTADRILPELESLRDKGSSSHACSGGSSGVPSVFAADMGSLATKVIADVSSLNTTAKASLAEISK
jgi:hypothetical protein